MNKSKTKTKKVSKDGRPTAYDRQQHHAICEHFGIPASPDFEVSALLKVHQLQAQLDATEAHLVVAVREMELEQYKWTVERGELVSQIGALRGLVQSALASRNRMEDVNIDLQLKCSAAQSRLTAAA